MAQMTLEAYLKRILARNAPKNTSDDRLDEAVAAVRSAATECGIDLIPTFQKTHDLNGFILRALDKIWSESPDPKPDERYVVYPNGGVEIVDKIGPGDRGGGGSGSSEFERAN